MYFHGGVKYGEGVFVSFQVVFEELPFRLGEVRVEATDESMYEALDALLMLVRLFFCQGVVVSSV